VGPCRGIELGDQLWASRFILLRMADQFRLTASLDPKPLPGDWPGNGAHVKVRPFSDGSKLILALGQRLAVRAPGVLGYKTVSGLLRAPRS